MQKITRLGAVMTIVLGLVMPALADRASSLYSQGQNAEARGDYATAYADYQQAWQLKPKSAVYKTALARMRFQAGAQLVHQGQILRDQGKLEQSLALFQRAAAIDPASPIAQQEIRRTNVMMQASQSEKSGEGTVQPQSFQKRLEGSTGAVELQSVSNAPITLRMTEDSKVAYETIGKLAGINVLFDPEYTSKRVKIELNGVTLGEALEIVALESKTFWRPVTPNTIFVAADTPAKRKELEQNLVKTFYLSNLSQPTELQDVVNTLRTILEVSRLAQIPSQGAVVVRGTPDQIALAEKLIDDLDKARPEVVVDVLVMQVNREKMKNLGITPPQSVSLQLQNNLTSTTNTTTTTTTTTPGTTTPTSSTPNGVTLNDIAHLNATDFLVTLAQGTANFLFSDSDTKLIQNPQIRALDGQKASLKIGERVPVATGSFGAGIGGVGVTNSLVNTQFQYLDVGVNIDITPRIHAGREVSMKLSLEISEVDSTTSIGGISQPVIGQRKIEHEIRLRDGEVNLLGGLLEDSDTRTLSGYPWLSQIPILKYFFSSTNTDRLQNELVFVLVPHIVRGQELSSLNVKPLDIGTANSIQLRQFGAPQPPPTNNNNGQPSPTGTQGPANQAPPNPTAKLVPANAGGLNAVTNPGFVPASTAVSTLPSPAAAGSGVLLSFNPAEKDVAKGETFMMDLAVSGAQNLFSGTLEIQYDPARLQVLNVSNGGFMGQGQLPVALVQRDDNQAGRLKVTASRPPNAGGVSGQGNVLTLTFMAKNSGKATVAISDTRLQDAGNQPMNARSTQATVNIK